MNGDDVTYFDRFRVGYIAKEIKKFLCNRNITTNINRIQANDSIMCGYFCIKFIDFILKDKTLLVNLLFPLKGYLRYKTIFYRKEALDVKLIIFFI